MSRFHFIVNPAAGHGVSIEVFEKLEGLLKQKHIDYTCTYSNGPGHIEALSRQALHEGHGCIVAVGGDGTVRETAIPLVHTKAVMGLIPCGTGNDLARVLKIPQDPVGALDVLLSERVMQMDVARANDLLYLNVAGFGFDVDVVENMQRYRHTRGIMPYLVGLFRAWFHLKTREIIVEAQEEAFRCQALIVAAANGTHFGGGMQVAPEADPGDGMLDVLVAYDLNRGTVMRLLSGFVKGKHLAYKQHVKYFKTRELFVRSEEPSRLQLDGEICSSTPVHFCILPKALNVIAAC